MLHQLPMELMNSTVYACNGHSRPYVCRARARAWARGRGPEGVGQWVWAKRCGPEGVSQWVWARRRAWARGRRPVDVGQEA